MNIKENSCIIIHTYHGLNKGYIYTCSTQEVTLQEQFLMTLSLSKTNFQVKMTKFSTMCQTGLDICPFVDQIRHLGDPYGTLPLFDKDRIQSEVVAVVNLSTRPRPVQLVMDQVRKNSSCLVVMQPQPNGLDSLSWHSKFSCCCKHTFTSPTAQTNWFWWARHPSRSFFFLNMFYLQKKWV